jgi:hypothetical protein
MAKTRPEDSESDDPGIPYARTKDPVQVDGPSPSENSRLRAATAIQSSVEPESYTEEQREEQVAAATGSRKP